MGTSLKTKTQNPLISLAFLTATACSLHFFESLLMRLLPLPFLRLGLSNIVIIYLLLDNRVWQAVMVNVTKSIIGGLITFSLLAPGTVLSLLGGITAIVAMWLAKHSKAGFSIFGVSICGAIGHNLAQLLLVKRFILPEADVFVLTPILLSLALFSGIMTAWILLFIQTRYDLIKTVKDET